VKNENLAREMNKRIGNTRIGLTIEKVIKRAVEPPSPSENFEIKNLEIR